MRIGLYIEHGVGNGVGGAELMMAHLASAWSHDHAVDLIHHRPPLTRERIELFSEDDFSRVTFRCVPREEEPDSGNPLRRYAAARAWHKAVSAGYDVFVNCTHWLPCFSHARKGVLLVLFPFYVRPEETPEIQELAGWKRARHGAYYGFEWQRRLATYHRRYTISEFSRQWTERRWHLDTRIMYPPVDIDSRRTSKESLILSVGRFSTMAHTKKQLEMMTAFQQLHDRLPAWSYACVGGLNAREENHQYFARVRQLSDGYPAAVEANLERTRIKELYGRARVFWHATGLGEDATVHPELAEHFGIATVEAMAAGCVPVVINRGGQANIVQHGENGFLWNTLDEMLHYTERLARDTALWTRMSEAARTRATQFSRTEFISRMTDACLGT